MVIIVPLELVKVINLVTIGGDCETESIVIMASDHH